jgi:hypothetical protein
MKHFIKFVACALFLFSAESAIACSCGNMPTCEAYGSAKAVFTGKVTQGNAAERMSDMLKASTKGLTFKFSVTRAFLGVKKGDLLDIHSGFGFGDCGFPFEKGQEYLVYAFEDDGNLETGICSRTRHISQADEEITALDALSLTDGASVSGTLTRYDQSSLFGEPLTTLPRKSVKLIRVGSPATYSSITDKNGNFEFTGLQTGRYKLRIDIGKGWTIKDYQVEEFLLNKHGCAYKNLSVENDADVKVVVLDPDANPVKNIRVEWVPVDVTGTMNRFPKEFYVTNPEGGLYLFDQPPGRYTISINFLNAADKDAPFPATFAPGVLDRDKARIVEIKPGSKIDDIVIKISKRLEERTISGSVFWPDGTPAKADVFLLDMVVPEGAAVDYSVETDHDGLFHKTGYSGRRYKIHVRAERQEGERNVIYRAETGEFSSDNQANGFRIILHASDD